MTVVASPVVGALLMVAAGGVHGGQAAGAATTPRVDLNGLCTPQAMSAVLASAGGGVVVKTVPNGPQLPGGVKLNAADGRVPAFCQVTGSYVTNPKTGKTANFLATFPDNWNGKYLQLGCSGACGYLLMNDPNSPPITVTAQGYPRQLIEKGYAVFGNDLGHVLPGPATANFDWLRGKDGRLDEDSLVDYLYRADQVMADLGKALTRAVYSHRSGGRAEIGKSYFSGCSQGGREALVAATRFPDKFDGIVAGSPLSDSTGILFKQLGLGLMTQRLSPAKFSPAQVKLVNDRVLAQCDAIDGARDGLIQNPSACGFRASRDLPICKAGESGDTCVTKAQADMVGATLAAVTDESGRVLHPGFPTDALSWGTVGPEAGSGAKLESDLRFIVGPAFDGRPLGEGRAGGAGQVQEFHFTASGAPYRRYLEAMRAGTPMPEDFDALLKRNGKLLWYHNLADEALTPYMSFYRYKRLAAMHGGYANLQRNIRLFAVPSTGHCGLGGSGPSNFDAIGALEKWVEKGEAPKSLEARSVDPGEMLMGKINWGTPAKRTMPLCPFPQMARYRGRGDVALAASWECRADDHRMLQVGPSGVQAGVSQ